MITRAGGSVSKLEEFLGLPSGSLGTNPVRIDIDSPSGLRMASGNESGANEYWLPGEYTSGGTAEAIIDPVPAGEYTVSSIFN